MPSFIAPFCLIAQVLAQCLVTPYKPKRARTGVASGPTLPPRLCLSAQEAPSAGLRTDVPLIHDYSTVSTAARLRLHPNPALRAEAFSELQGRMWALVLAPALGP